jgi:hypothetical protein
MQFSQCFFTGMLRGQFKQDEYFLRPLQLSKISLCLLANSWTFKKKYFCSDIYVLIFWLLTNLENPY